MSAGTFPSVLNSVGFKIPLPKLLTIEFKLKVVELSALLGSDMIDFPPSSIQLLPFFEDSAV